MNKTIQFPNPDTVEHERLPEPEETRQPREKILLDERGMLDMPFLVLTVLLVIIGVIMMFSASYLRPMPRRAVPPITLPVRDCLLWWVLAACCLSAV